MGPGPVRGLVDAGEQPADAVAGAGSFSGQVVVEADQDTEFGEGFVAGVDAAQRVRHGAGGVGDDVGVAGVCFGLSGIEIGDAAHRQTGQVGDVVTAGARDGDRQCTDGVGLIDHDQQRPVCGELVENRS